MPEVNPLTLTRLVQFKDYQKYQTESSCIEDVTYDPETLEMTVVFIKRGTYKYLDVPLDEYVDFVTSSSQGKYFNNYIRDMYSFQRLSF